jgi:hypothetical protein
LLELFSGTGSAGKVASELGYTVISLDRDMRASIQIDIMDWDYTDLNPRMFDVIWASPPRANEVMKRTLDIMEYFKPKYWIIERPQAGLSYDQKLMNGIPYNDVDYCKYGMPYKKRTRMWNNIEIWTPNPLCAKNWDSMTRPGLGTYIQESQQAGSTAERRSVQQLFRTLDLYVVPAELIKELFLACDLDASDASGEEDDEEI